MAQVLPHQDNTAGIFCLTGCDSKYEMLQEETRKLPNKNTFGGGSGKVQVNANGIPPYYYQKPEVTGAANGGGAQANKRVKKDGA